MPSLRSLTAALALALTVPFAGASASDAVPHSDCAETASVKAATKESNTAPAPVNKTKQAASLSDAAATAAKLPVKAKAAPDPGQPKLASVSPKKNRAAPQSVHKHKNDLPGSCC